MPMPICNHFHERLANNSKITTFTGSTALWCPRAQVSLNLEYRDLNHRNLRSMLKISFAASPCLYQLISTQFALEMCLAARKIHKKKLLLWCSRSSKVIKFSGNRQPVYDFLLVIHSNLSPISHRYWDTATYWSKIANFAHPLWFSVLVRGDPLWIYKKALRFLKLESSGQPTVKIWWF